MSEYLLILRTPCRTAWWPASAPPRW